MICNRVKISLPGSIKSPGSAVHGHGITAGAFRLPKTECLCRHEKGGSL